MVAKDAGRFFGGDVFVVAAQGGLGRRGIERLLEPVALAHATRQFDPAHGPRGLVFLPARARQIAADDRLDRQDLELFDQHRAAAQDLCVLAHPFRHGVNVGGDQMVRTDVFKQMKPEQADLGKDLALAGNPVGHHHIEGAQTIRGDEEQMVGIDLEDLADFAAGEQFEAGEFGFQQAFSHGKFLERPVVRSSGRPDVRRIPAAGSMEKVRFKDDRTTRRPDDRTGAIYLVTLVRISSSNSLALKLSRA